MKLSSKQTNRQKKQQKNNNNKKTAKNNNNKKQTAKKTNKERKQWEMNELVSVYSLAVRALEGALRAVSLVEEESQGGHGAAAVRASLVVGWEGLRLCCRRGGGVVVVGNEPTKGLSRRAFGSCGGGEQTNKQTKCIVVWVVFGLFFVFTCCCVCCAVFVCAVHCNGEFCVFQCPHDACIQGLWEEGGGRKRGRERRAKKILSNFSGDAPYLVDVISLIVERIHAEDRPPHILVTPGVALLSGRGKRLRQEQVCVAL